MMSPIPTGYQSLNNPISNFMYGHAVDMGPTPLPMSHSLPSVQNIHTGYVNASMGLSNPSTVTATQSNGLATSMGSMPLQRSASPFVPVQNPAGMAYPRSAFQPVSMPLPTVQGSSAMTVQENRHMTLSPTPTGYQSLNNPIRQFPRKFTHDRTGSPHITAIVYVY